MNHKCDKDRELDFIISVQREMYADIKTILVEVAEVKIKTSIWGALSGGVSGLLVTVGAIIMAMYSKKL